MTMRLVIALEGNSSHDCVHVAHVGPEGRSEAVLRRGDAVAMPLGGRVEVVSATHGDQDMPHVLMLPVQTRPVERARWLPVSSNDGCSTNDAEPEGGCTAA